MLRVKTFHPSQGYVPHFLGRPGPSNKAVHKNSGTVVEKADTEWAPGSPSMGGSTIHADSNKAGRLAQYQGAGTNFYLSFNLPKLLHKNRALGMLH